MVESERAREEVARRGEELYERSIRAIVEAGNEGSIVVMDVDSGAYAIADELLGAARRVRQQHPDARLYAMRIGFPALAKLGGSWGQAGRSS